MFRICSVAAAAAAVMTLGVLDDARAPARGAVPLAHLRLEPARTP